MDYPKKVITIEAISDRPDKKKAALKASDGNWYETFRDWQGTFKQAYAQLKSFKKGETVEITYQVGEYNGNPQYQLMAVVPAEGSQVAPRPESPHSGQNSASGGPVGGNGRPPTDAYGRRLGIQGHINALLGNTKIYPTNSLESVVALAIKAEDEAERQLAGGPAIDIGDDIPFED